jgi:hypothetical protein
MILSSLLQKNVLPRPIDGDHEPIMKSHYCKKTHKKPHKPRCESFDFHPVDFGHNFVFANGGEESGIPVAKHKGNLPTIVSQDLFGCKFAHPNRNLSHHGNGMALLLTFAVPGWLSRALLFPEALSKPLPLGKEEAKKGDPTPHPEPSIQRELTHDRLPGQSEFQ